MKAEKRKKIPSYIHKKSNSPRVNKKKIKFHNTTNNQDEIRAIDTLSQIDDSNESTNGPEITVQGNPPKNTVASNYELTFNGAMTMEELNSHIQKCLEMSSENKITPKNAFALQLIDCMNLLLQKEDFSVMACTLDAGQKIYAYRVDGLHQQVIKLAEEIIKNNRNKKCEREAGGEESDEPLKKEARKAKKRNILAESEILKRTLKTKDPKEKFVKIDGLPGAILSSVRRDPEDLSFTLQNSVRFWHDQEISKPLTASGSVTIPQCEIQRDKSGEKYKLPRFSPTQKEVEANESDTVNSPAEYLDLSDDVIMDGSVEADDMPNEIGGREDKQSGDEEMDVISTAIKRLNDEAEEVNGNCNVPSQFETMKMIFNHVSDYHYLNVDKAHYWAGPQFWKRPKVTSKNCTDKKRVVRKKKLPNSISYTGPAVEENLIKLLKKGSRLNKKTIMGWKMKHVTYPTDLKIGVGKFLELFNLPEFFEHEENAESSEMEINSIESDKNCDSYDSFEDNITMDPPDSQNTLNSSFYETAPENCTSPDHGDPLNSAFYDAGLTQKSEKVSPESGKIIKVQFPNSDNSDTSFVPAPKMVNFQPIKYKTKPIRVDMQHLKQTMWGIINENNEHKKENTSGDGTLSGTKFSSVLKQLPARLEKRTAEDLFPGMGLLALLTLANENNLQLKNSDDYSDVVINLEPKDLDIDKSTR